MEATASTRSHDVSDLDGFKEVILGFLSRMDEAAKHQWMKDQVYIALGNLMTVCANMRIDACPMEGFIAPEYDNVLGLTDMNLASVVVCPVGYRSADDKYGSLNKVRYSKDELVVRMK